MILMAVAAGLREGRGLGVGKLYTSSKCLGSQKLKTFNFVTVNMKINITNGMFALDKLGPDSPECRGSAQLVLNDVF